MSVTKKNVSNFFCQKRLFSEFGPLEFGLEYEKFEIAEDIHTNCVIHFEKLVVLLKDFHMKFISNIKVYFIKASWRHYESLKFKNILIFHRLPDALYTYLLYQWRNLVGILVVSIKLTMGFSFLANPDNFFKCPQNFKTGSPTITKSS